MFRPVRKIGSSRAEQGSRQNPTTPAKPAPGREQGAGAPMWTAPCLQEAAQSFDRIACSHMSGLLVRSPLTAGRDGFRDASSEHGSGIGIPLGTTDCLAFWIDRSHHLLVLEQAAAQRDAAQRDAAQRDAACRFPPIWLCCLVRPGRDGMGGIVVLSADHQLPGDAGHPRPAPGQALLASATAASLGDLRLSSSASHGVDGPLFLATGRLCRAAPAGSRRLRRPPARCARPRRRRG